MGLVSGKNNGLEKGKPKVTNKTKKPSQESLFY
jgi:hypothetical protein